MAAGGNDGKGGDIVRTINTASGGLLIVLSVTASVVPWSLAWLRGFDQPPLEDEGASAHIFQLSMAVMVPTLLVFLATADWTRPRNVARRLAIPTALVVLSFAALFYYEQIYVPAHF